MHVEECCVWLSGYMAQCTGIGAVLSFGKVILQSVLILALTWSMIQGLEDPFSHLQNFPNSWSAPERPGPLIVLPNIDASAQAYPNLFRFDLQHGYTSQALCPIRFSAPHAPRSPILHIKSSTPTTWTILECSRNLPSLCPYPFQLHPTHPHE